MPRLAKSEEFTSTVQASKALGVAVRTVQLWVDAGILPAWRSVGGHRYICRSAVNSLLESLKKNDKSIRKKDIISSTFGLRFLLISPDTGVQMAASRFACDARATSITITDCASKGLIHLGQSRFNLIVLDLSIDNVDIVELLKFLRNEMAERGKYLLLAIPPLDDIKFSNKALILELVTGMVDRKLFHASLMNFRSAM